MNDALQQRLLSAFMAACGGAPELVVQAPGRVNLIGEHTDYNDGFVLPCAIDFHTRVAVRRRADATVRVVAVDLDGAQDQFGVDEAIDHDRQQPWTDYVRGVFAMLVERGFALRGADIAIAGNVPQGAGLSSSAALEVAVALAVRELQGLHGLSANDLAQVAQDAENRFAGCQCGIMDQLASARGQAGHALLIDCRSLAAEPVPLPDGLTVMIVHSHVRRGLVDSKYNQRRLQCQAAAAHLGVPALRDATPALLQSAAATMEPIAWRRARHVVSENERTLEAARALAEGDLRRMGRLMAQSHASMRDDFQITVPAIDRLVDILQQAIGEQGGARMTGGGFGGCVVALMPTARVPVARDAVAAHYRSPQGEPGTVWITGAAAGAARC